MSWFLALVVLASVAIGTAVAAHLNRVEGSELKLVPGSHGYVATELGRFQYDPARAVLRVRSNRNGQLGAPIEVPVPQGARLYDVTATRDRIASELLLRSGSVDLLPPFRDQEFVTVIALESREGSVPLMCLKQYRWYGAIEIRRDFVLSWLRLFRLYEDIQAVTLTRSAELADALRGQGLRIG